MDSNEIKEIMNELEILKERKRNGWQIRGLPEESIAEHSFGTAIFSLILSNMVSDVDEEKCLSLALIHDFIEAKTSDLDKITQKYINKTKIQNKAIKDSSALIENLTNEYKRDTRETKIVRDADRLDMANRAKKLIKLGYSEELLNEFLEPNLFFEESRMVFELINSD